MALYLISRENATPVAGDMMLSLTTGLQEICKVRGIMLGGEAGASTVNRMAVRRSTTNLITPTAQTPAKKSSTSPAAYTDAATTAGTQPVTAALPALWTVSLNTFGGIVTWSAGPDEELLIQGATAGNNELSLESASGTGVLSGEMCFEEV